MDSLALGQEDEAASLGPCKICTEDFREATHTPGYNRQDLVDICNFLNAKETK